MTISSISTIPQPPTQPTQVNFTLNWDEPFTNFDPILNYTIITTCSDATVCPITHVTSSDVTTLGFSFDVLVAVNYTISITANNNVGTSNATTRILVGEYHNYVIKHVLNLSMDYLS